MTDSFLRELTYLRVSVTDRCNLRCGYCMPDEGVPSIPHTEVLSFDEITRVVRIMAGLGVWRVRLTGGEPLVRKDISALASEIKKISGISYLGITTNGVLLKEAAPALLTAGVDSINLSLDTLDKQRYIQLTKRDELDRVLKSLYSVLDMGFKSVKLNCVLAPQSTEADWLGVVSLARDLPVDVRLIEWMPMAGEVSSKGAPSAFALDTLTRVYGPLRPALSVQGGGPARLWNIEGFKGRLGIIHAMTHNFCAECNRLRLTAVGDLKLCLFYDAGISLKPLLRGGASDAEISAAIEEAVLNKPLRHMGKVQAVEENSNAPSISHPAGMYKTGG